MPTTDDARDNIVGTCTRSLMMPGRVSVFISHATADDRIARRIAGDLSGADISVYLDDWDKSVGVDLPKSLQNRIGKSTWLVALLSPAALESRWVMLEIQLALRLHKNRTRGFLIPVWLPDYEPRPLSEALAEVGQVKAIDLRPHANTSYQEALQLLLDRMLTTAATSEEVDMVKFDDAVDTQESTLTIQPVELPDRTFDGWSWTCGFPEMFVGQHTILAVEETPGGDLWIALESGTIFRHSDRGWEQFNPWRDRTSPLVYTAQIASSSDDNVWILYGDHVLVHFSGERFSCYHLRTDEAGGHLCSIDACDNDAVIAASSMGIVIGSSGTWRCVTAGSERHPASGGFGSVHAQSVASIWSTKGSHLLHFDGHQFRRRDIGHKIDTLAVVSPRWVYAAGYEGEVTFATSRSELGHLPAYGDKRFIRLHALARDDLWGSTRDRVYHWNGDHWDSYETEGARLTDMCTRPGGAVWACGEQDSPPPKPLLRRLTHRSWQDCLPPYEAFLTSIGAAAGDSVWAAGTEGTILRFDGVHWDDAHRSVFPERAGRRDDVLPEMAMFADIMSHMSGRATRHAAPYVTLRRVRAFARDNVWLVGDYGPPATVAHYNGTSWSLVPLPDKFTHGVEDVFGTAIDDVWLLCHGDLFHWDGKRLRRRGPGGHAMSWTADGAVFVVHHEGLFFNDGRRWLRPRCSIRVNLRDVFALTANRMWAVGMSDKYGVIVSLDEDGWREARVPLREHVETFQSVFALAENNVWVVGGGGVVYNWDGLQWQRVRCDTRRHLSSVTGVRPDHVWISGEDGTILRRELQRMPMA